MPPQAGISLSQTGSKWPTTSHSQRAPNGQRLDYPRWRPARSSARSAAAYTPKAASRERALAIEKRLAVAYRSGSADLPRDFDLSSRYI